MSTDVHGNGEDFAALEKAFHAKMRDGAATHWVIPGDVVHAPNADARSERPDLFDDEVAALEVKISAEERARLASLFERALLAVAAPCGVLLTHGSPDESLRDLRDLDDVPLAVDAMTPDQRKTVRSLLTSYGQADAVSAAMLANVSRALGISLGVVIHGHDRDESGFFREGDHQRCPCIFGAARAEKRYVELDLAARYENVHALRDGSELRRLHAE